MIDPIVTDSPELRMPTIKLCTDERSCCRRSVKFLLSFTRHDPKRFLCHLPGLSKHKKIVLLSSLSSPTNNQVDLEKIIQYESGMSIKFQQNEAVWNDNYIKYTSL